MKLLMFQHKYCCFSCIFLSTVTKTLYTLVNVQFLQKIMNLK